MFELGAPYPGLQTKTLLPNPTLSDQKSLAADVTIYRAYDGTTYSYVRSKDGRFRFLWPFRLSRPKGAELQAFYEAYFGSKLRVVDHNGNVWIGYIINNPFELDTPLRAAPARGDFGAEYQTVTIEFEGVAGA